MTLKLIEKVIYGKFTSYKFESDYYVLTVLKDNCKVTEEKFSKKDDSYPDILKSEIGYNLKIELSDEDNDFKQKESIKKSLRAIKTIENAKRIKARLEGDCLK